DPIDEAPRTQGHPPVSLTPVHPLDYNFTGTTVYHPHGLLTASMTADECANTRIVLSEEDYHGLYGNPSSWANLVQLSLFLSHPCIFVGATPTNHTPPSLL